MSELIEVSCQWCGAPFVDTKANQFGPNPSHYCGGCEEKAREAEARESWSYYDYI